ncbi:MAG: dihydroorotase [Crocinitomicaceae bacterium]|nr:dihydroorotase [Crocinitomicaceae bacterium]
MNRTLIKNATIVNEGKIFVTDVLIENERIEKISESISVSSSSATRIIDAEGKYLIPGVIDDQVHFRDPGLTHKADLYTESKAAVIGGVTSFMDMPNTIPNTLTLELLEKKYELASYKSLANFSFFMGITQDNLEEALRIDNSKVCGITDDGLYFNANNGILANHPDFLEKLFQKSNSLIALHSENEAIINENYSIYHDQFGDEIPFEFHPKIRSTEACVSSTKTVLDIAKKWDTRLHFFHISTLEEALLFDNSLPLHQKKITAEACVHHLWFSEKDYERLGGFIKWNPAIKTEKDKDGLLQCLLSNHLDLIATDHAPHSLKEKTGNYKNILSGGPLVQHSLLAMLTMYQQNKISLEKIIEKMCHAPAVAYRIQERGFIREGYFADLVMVDLHQTTQITRNQLAYKCGWSPFEGEEFQAKILKTFVNGNLVYNEGKINLINNGKRLTFNPLN